MQTYHIKKIISSFVVVLVAMLAFSIPAKAADETATVEMSMSPNSTSTLYKEAYKPVNMRIGVEVKAPYPASLTVQPIKNVKVKFPGEMKFVPGNTAVCPDSKIGKEVDTSFDPVTLAKKCPNSVIGNGTAGLYLARGNSASGPTLTDPLLTIFNAGYQNGRPRIKILGYSSGTGVGIYMEGYLTKDNYLSINIPVLSYDSAIGDFNLNFPGYSTATAPSLKGKNKSYVQAKCSSGSWATSADFTLGTRDTAGEPISPSTFANASVTTPCVGAKGTSKLGYVKVAGSKKIKAKKAKTYKVTLRNPGTATTKFVKIKVSGFGVVTRTQKVSSLAPGQVKTFNVKAKLNSKAKKGKKVTIKFRASANGVAAKTGSIKVKVT